MNNGRDDKVGTSDHTDSLVKIIIEPYGRQIPVHNGTRVLKAALIAGIKVRSECGGKGNCSKCRIIVKNQNNLNDLTINERKHLTRLEIESGYRLACQALLYGNTVIMIPPESRIELRKIQVTGYERQLTLDPAIKKHFVKLSKPSLEDTTPDLERLIEQLGDFNTSLSVDQRTLKTLPQVLRDSDWKTTVTIWNDQNVINVEPGDTSDELYGAAIDVGTSKIVVYTVNLVTGETIGTGSVENPQTIYGEDIITRSMSANEETNAQEMLQRNVIEGINQALKKSVNEANINPQKICVAVIVGNTVMHHLMLGIETRHLVVAPFTPTVRRGLTLTASQLGIQIYPRAIVDVLPLLAGFIGSDALSDVLATGIAESDETSLLLDIGTNTEIFLGNRDKLVSCSCASGPAFEGGHIQHGVKAVTGAIERVTINPKSLEASYETIEGGKPRGLCGSAMIDTISELFRNQVIDNTGMFHPRPDSKAFRKMNGKTEYILASAAETATGTEIVITQNDIFEILRAKAAIFAGYSILLKRRKLVDADIKRIYVAGAFGQNIDPKNAKTIGLLPALPSERIMFVGNTAVTGAKMALNSRQARARLDELSTTTDYVELSADPLFKNEYASALFIPHRDIKRFNLKK